MRRKIILAFIFCVIASCAWGEARVFVEYPTLGECTGNNVRIRSKPNTSSKILGSLDEYNQVIVLGKVKSGKDVWYEIENPEGKGKAYVFGKYLFPAYRQEYQRSPQAKMWVDIMLTYGKTPENILALSGNPKNFTRKNDDGILFITGDWGDYRILYIDNDEEEDIKGYLKAIEVKRGNKSFGNIRIGDSTSKLRRELGDPENKSDSLWEYEFYLYGYDEGVEELVDACFVRFTIEDGKVSHMYCYKHENGEDEETTW